MSAINITSVNVLDNPSYFVNPLQLEIQYECLYPLQHGELLSTLSFLQAGTLIGVTLSFWVQTLSGNSYMLARQSLKSMIKC